MPPVWRLRLLGGLVLEGPDTDSERIALPASRAAALLARLALPTVGRRYRREALAELLWPGAPEPQARHRLRQTLVELRRLLRVPDVLVTSRETIHLAPGLIETDVAAFEEAVRAGDCARAADRYAGDLLPALDEPWVGDERERLRVAFLDCLRTLAHDTDPRVALDAARRLAAEDPGDGEASLLLIRLLAAEGRSDAARREFERFRKAARRAGSAVPPAFLKQARTELRRAAHGGAEYPDHAAATTVPRSLPGFLTRFFGREEELDQLCGLVRDPQVRLVTLVGTGGTGKTRLAVEAAARVDCPAYFIGLADTPAQTSAAGVLARIATALGLPRTVEDAGALARAIAGRGALDENQPAVLLLDNLEHLLLSGGASEAVLSLLQCLPSLTILATSRLPIGLAGEALFPVKPLAMPAGCDLFEDRVRALIPGFRITDDNATAVESVCRRLDGLPLALEIAAGWARSVTPQEMLERLERRFEFLRRRDGTPTDRHHSLETALAWSYDALPAPVARFFRHLCVFQGGFTAEAAATVVGGEEDAQVCLETLCDHNLVLAEPASERLPQQRFTLLETLRAFAAERLTPQEASAARWRHVAYFAELAQAGEAGLKGPDQGLWWERLAVEKPNLRVAFAQPDRAPEDGVLRAWLASRLMEFWRQEDVLEAMEWAGTALAIPGLPDNLRGRLLVAQGGFLSAFRDRAQGQAMLAESIGILRASGDTQGLIVALAHWADNPDALAEAVTLGSCIGQWHEVGTALCFQAMTAAYREDRIQAERGFAAARQLALERRTWIQVQASLLEEAYHRARWGDLSIAAEMLEDIRRLSALHGLRDNSQHTCLHRLARLRHLQGEWEPAHALLRDAEAHIRERGWKESLVETLLLRARLHADLYETDAARACLNERDRLRAALHPGSRDGSGLTVRAEIALAEGDAASAARHATDALRAFGNDAFYGWRMLAWLYRGAAALDLEDGGGVDRYFQAALGDLYPEHRGAIARPLVAQALEACGQGVADASPWKAAYALGFAAAERDAMGIVLPPAGRPRHAGTIEHLRNALGPDELRRKWDSGAQATVVMVVRRLTARE